MARKDIYPIESMNMLAILLNTNDTMLIAASRDTGTTISEQALAVSFYGVVETRSRPDDFSNLSRHSAQREIGSLPIIVDLFECNSIEKGFAETTSSY